MAACERSNYREGFTLIELSIVLVIIGLIVGGVLVGQDLMRAAEVRATITQIEKFNTAVNTFQGKYGYLPGDIKDPEASNFGFKPRGTVPGEGDGNGVLQSVTNIQILAPNIVSTGELGAFWVDLSAAHLIEANYTFVDPTNPYPYTVTSVGSPAISDFLPAAKLGLGNYIYVYSGGISGVDSTNYFGLSAVYTVSLAPPESNPGLPVRIAYAIDQKIDDGLPQTGNVTAQYVDFLTAGYNQNQLIWAGGIQAQGASSGSPSFSPTTTATPGSSTTCYDNGGNTGNQQYSLEQSGGAGVNCGLSFRFQ